MRPSGARRNRGRDAPASGSPGRACRSAGRGPARRPTAFSAASSVAQVGDPADRRPAPRRARSPRPGTSGRAGACRGCPPGRRGRWCAASKVAALVISKTGSVIMSWRVGPAARALRRCRGICGSARLNASGGGQGNRRWPPAVLASRSGPSIGCRKNRSKASPSNRAGSTPACGIDQLQLLARRLGQRRVGLGADADPVDRRPARRWCRWSPARWRSPAACSAVDQRPRRAAAAARRRCSTTSRSSGAARARRPRPRRPAPRRREPAAARPVHADEIGVAEAADRLGRGPARARSTGCSRRSGRTPPRGPAWPPSPCRVRKISLTA